MSDELNARPATPHELALTEENAARSVQAWMDAYLAFPTAGNFDGVTQRMRVYQDAWMNGRGTRSAP